MSRYDAREASARRGSRNRGSSSSSGSGSNSSNNNNGGHQRRQTYCRAGSVTLRLPLAPTYKRYSPRMKRPRLACDAGERNWIEHVALRSPPRQNGRMGPNGMRKERNYTLLVSRNKRAHSWEREKTRRRDTDEREAYKRIHGETHESKDLSSFSLSSMQPLLRSSSRVNANETTSALVSHRGRCSGEYILCIRIPSLSTMSDGIARYSPTSARQMPLTDAISSSNST